MRNALVFFDPDRELKNLQDLATAQFQEIYQQKKSAGESAPTVEEVFPGLSSLAGELGCTSWSPISFDDFSAYDLPQKIGQLEQYVEAVFHAMPHATSSLLDVQPPQYPPLRVSSPPSQEVKGRAVKPEEKIFQPETPAVQAGGNAAIPALPLQQPGGTAGTAMAVVTKEEPRAKAKDVAYEVAQALLAKVKIKILGEAIYSYTGRYYQHITAENLRRLIMAICRKEVEDEGNSRLVGEVYRLLLVEPTICEKPEEVSSNFVSFSNGVLDLRTGQLYPHDPRYNTYYELGVSYGLRQQGHPVFDRFLASITGGDATLAQRILEIIGYCLVPDMSGKVFFVFQGVPDSGKSVLAAFIRGCFNPDAVVAMDILSLGERFSASSLIGKQLCTSMDLPAAPLNAKSVSSFKMLTGGDPVTCDVKYAPHITFYNTAKFIFGTNHPILTQNSDLAFYRRAVAVPFLNSTPKEYQDFNLLEKLNGERDAIVNDAIQAYLMLRHRHYVFSGNYMVNDIFEGALPMATQSVDALLQQFVREYCVTGEQYDCFVDDLYQEFCAHFGETAIAYERFSAPLIDACMAMGYREVQKTQKKRGPGDKNPRAHLAGITLRNTIAIENSKQ